MLTAMFALAIAAQGAPASIQIDAVRANWSSFPRLERAPRPLPTAGMVDQLVEILDRGQCSLAGATPTQFDFDVPFAVMLEPDGRTTRVIVQDMSCPPLESLVGEIALEMARQGDFRPTGRTQAAWHADTINFNLE